MKCEDLWSRIETGNVVRKLAARWHAARCPRCRESLAQLAAMKRELARAEPISAVERRLWARAAEVEVAAAEYRTSRLAVAAGLAAAALLVVAIVGWTTGLRPGHEPSPRGPRLRSPVAPVAVKQVQDEALPQAIADIRSGLMALSEELDRLSVKASLLEERGQVNQLLSECEQRSFSAQETTPPKEAISCTQASSHTLAVGKRSPRPDRLHSG